MANKGQPNQPHNKPIQEKREKDPQRDQQAGRRQQEQFPQGQEQQRPDQNRPEEKR